MTSSRARQSASGWLRMSEIKLLHALEAERSALNSTTEAERARFKAAATEALAESARFHAYAQKTPEGLS
jgi:hypothetical protein